MPTTVNVAYNDSTKVILLGRPSDSYPALGGQNAEARFGMTAEKCQITVDMGGNAGYLKWSYDGQTWITDASSAGGFHQLTIWDNSASGTNTGSIETHEVIVKVVTGMSLGGPGVGRTNFVIGTNTTGTPVAFLPKTFGGPKEDIWGTSFGTYGAHTFHGSISQLDPSSFGYSSPQMPYYQFSGSAAGASTATARRRCFWGAGSTFRVFSRGGQNPILVVDGVCYGQAQATDNFSGGGFYCYVFNLPGTATDSEVEVRGAQGVDSIMVCDPNGTGGFVSAAVPVRQEWFFNGTGYAAGHSISALAFFTLASLGKPVDMYLGVAGDGRSLGVIHGLLPTELGLKTWDGVAFECGRDEASTTDGTTYQTDITNVLNDCIAAIPGIKILMTGLDSGWAGAGATNAVLLSQTASWKTANPTHASQLHVFSPINSGSYPANGDWLQGDSLHVDPEQSPIGYGQTEGSGSLVLQLTGLPSDGNTVSITSTGGATKVFEFDSNSSVTSGHIAVTIGADAATTNRNFFMAVVAAWKAGWDGKPLTIIDYTYTASVLFNVATCTLSGATNQTKYGPYATGYSNALASFFQTTVSGSGAGAVAPPGGAGAALLTLSASGSASPAAPVGGAADSLTMSASGAANAPSPAGSGSANFSGTLTGSGNSSIIPPSGGGSASVGNQTAPSGFPVLLASPISADGTICVIQGDDYKAADGRAVAFDLSGISLVGATAKLIFSPINLNCGKAVNIFGSISGSIASIDVPASVTRALVQGNPSYLYWLIITLANGDVITPATGAVSVQGI